jgi:hypothetical protein
MKSSRTAHSPLSSKPIAWSKLKNFFEGQWVELVDYKWDWNAAAPSCARIRHHATDRSELLELIRQDKKIPGSVVLFIGAQHSSFEHSLSAAV